MNMIERVARASFKYWAKRKGMDFKFEDMPSDELEFALGHAKAAIAAMREPSEGMIDAGANSAGWHSAEEPTYEAPKCYKAMIDAALKEE